MKTLKHDFFLKEAFASKGRAAFYRHIEKLNFNMTFYIYKQE